MWNTLGDQIKIDFQIVKGWHINSNLTTVDSLIPLYITSIEKITLKYPIAKITQLYFIESDLSTFEGNFSITATDLNEPNYPLTLNIILQTCSNKICLAPSNIEVKVYSYIAWLIQFLVFSLLANQTNKLAITMNIIGIMVPPGPNTAKESMTKMHCTLVPVLPPVRV